jgi:hypothetical protein
VILDWIDGSLEFSTLTDMAYDEDCEQENAVQRWINYERYGTEHDGDVEAIHDFYRKIDEQECEKFRLEGYRILRRYSSTTTFNSDSLDSYDHSAEYIRQVMDEIEFDIICAEKQKDVEESGGY